MSTLFPVGFLDSWTPLCDPIQDQSIDVLALLDSRHPKRTLHLLRVMTGTLINKLNRELLEGDHGQRNPPIRHHIKIVSATSKGTIISYDISVETQSTEWYSDAAHR